MSKFGSAEQVVSWVNGGKRIRVGEAEASWAMEQPVRSMIGMASSWHMLISVEARAGDSPRALPE